MPPFDISYASHHRPTAVKGFETLDELPQQISYLLRRFGDPSRGW